MGNGHDLILHFGTSLTVHWLRLCLPMQGVQVGSLVGELGSCMPPGQKTKKAQNRSSIVANSIKTLKNGPHQKILKKKKILCFT